MLRLRPHHLLDIVRNIGNNREIIPHENGHNVHVITLELLNDINQDCRIIIKADDICKPCKKLNNQGKCTDILHQPEFPVSKQEYNDELDTRILNHLGMEPGTIMKLKEFIELAAADLENIVPLCTHPEEDPDYRRNGLINGFRVLGISYPPYSRH
jgi:hypothetical protein